MNRRRQILYWRLLARTFGLEDNARGIEALAGAIADELEAPRVILDADIAVDTLLRRHPKLEPAFDALKHVAWQDTAGEGEEQPAAEVDPHEGDLLRTLAYGKLVMSVFGPNARTPSCSAQQYQQWTEDVGAFERYLGYAPGSLRGRGGGGGGGGGGGRGTGPGGQAPRIDDARLREELVAMESDLIKRMDLREVLQDDALAAKITPTLAVVEQLLYDKSNLTGGALKNARSLIRRYVDELAEVLKKQVMSSSTGQIDRSVPPKRVFRNLDLKRTLWRNLPNYNPEDGRLYVNQLYYRHTAQKELMSHFIIVVDQSGSMVDAMVQCAILASIFASLPRLRVTLLAYDTSCIDLTPWVGDPFEALMRTNLGGGTHGPVAMAVARELIDQPRRTTLVWISDFFDDRSLLAMWKAVREAGVHFIPVGSVSGRGYFSVDGWFRDELKKMGTPILTGNIKKLIVELKNQLA